MPYTTIYGGDGHEDDDGDGGNDPDFLALKLTPAAISMLRG